MQRSLLPQSCLASLAQLKQWERNYQGSTGRFTYVCIKAISKCMLHFLEVLGGNLKSTGIAPGDGYTIFCEKGTSDCHLEAMFWV